jgi:hypothetical protein
MFSIAGFSLKFTSPVRSNLGPMQTASHASRPSFDRMKLEMIKKMQKADKTKSDVRSAVCAPVFLFFLPVAYLVYALFRDGYRCMITGGYDYDSCVKFPEILRADKAGVVVSAECAIFSLSWHKTVTK